MTYQNLTVRADWKTRVEGTADLGWAQIYANAGDYVLARKRETWFRRKQPTERVLDAVSTFEPVDWEH